MEAILNYLINVDGGKVIAVLGLLAWIDMRKKLDRMVEALSSMGLGHATLVERVDGHEKRIVRVEDHVFKV